MKQHSGRKTEAGLISGNAIERAIALALRAVCTRRTVVGTQREPMHFLDGGLDDGLIKTTDGQKEENPKQINYLGFCAGGAGGSCYLREDFFNDQVYLEGDAEKKIIVGLFKHGDEFAGMWSWVQEPDALSLYGRLIVLAPEHRSAKLASKVVPLFELVGRAMGAEFLFGLATLKIPHMQHALETAGWQLIGFTSGYDREEVAPGVVKRVFEWAYVKVLVPEEELVRPDPKNLTPHARDLFDALFPSLPAVAAQSVMESGK